MSTSLSLRTTAVPEAAERDAASAETDLLGRERAVVHEVVRLVAERAAAEEKLAVASTSNHAKVDAEYQQSRQALVEKQQRLESEARAEDEQRRRGIVSAAMAGGAQAKAEFAAASRRIAATFDEVRETAKTEYSRAKGRVEMDFESGRRTVEKEHAQALKPIQDASRIADDARQRLTHLTVKYNRFGLDPALPPPSRENFAKLDDPVYDLLKRLDGMTPNLKLLEALFIPRLMIGGRWMGLVVGMAFLFGIGAAVAGGGITGAAAGAVVGVVLGVAARMGLVKVVRSQLHREYDPLMQALADVTALNDHCRGLAQNKTNEAMTRVTTRRDDDLRRAKENRAQTVSTGEADRDERLRRINEVYAQRMVEVETTQARDLRAAIDAHDRRLAELKTKFESHLQKLEENYLALTERLRQRHAASKQAMTERWRAGMQAAAAECDAVNREVDGYGPSWDDPSWADRSFPRRVPPVQCFGTMALELAALPQGIAADPALMEGVRSEFLLPALRSFPAGANLLIEAPNEGRAAALAVLQASMFRLLTSLPPGQVRFTIVDPLGIGRSFGAFMHLSDYDQALVTNQVWTDARQIDDRLAELAAHMETVTQKYLRNEYATIEEYNAVAGEVAEPYRVLVIADFPSQFHEKSAARLASIAASGVPCGVLTLVAVDPTKPLPTDFRLDDLRLIVRT